LIDSIFIQFGHCRRFSRAPSVLLKKTSAAGQKTFQDTEQALLETRVT